MKLPLADINAQNAMMHDGKASEADVQALLGNKEELINYVPLHELKDFGVSLKNQLTV